MLTGFSLFVAGVVYTVLIAVGAFFVGKRNGSKADDLAKQASAFVANAQTKASEITDTLKK